MQCNVHNNLRPHSPKQAYELLNRFWWEVWNHHAYSPHLSPCDFHADLHHRPNTPPTHTHTLESKVTKDSTLKSKENGQILKISDHKNVNKNKIRLAPVKLYSKKQHKK